MKKKIWLAIHLIYLAFYRVVFILNKLWPRSFGLKFKKKPQKTPKRQNKNKTKNKKQKPQTNYLSPPVNYHLKPIISILPELWSVHHLYNPVFLPETVIYTESEWLSKRKEISHDSTLSYIYIYIYQLADRSRERPESFLFISYYT